MKYDKRGVSADKTDVHEAIKKLDKGIFLNTFCKIIPDYIAGSNDHGIVMHADTAGTKTSLAYLYWKETGDLSVWKGIVQDALIMNVDDLACVGITDNIIISSTIGRNKNLISGDVIKTIIEGTQKYLDEIREFGINLYLSGGETADVGDIVRTMDVGFTAVARINRSDVIEVNIQPGDVIIGLESYGQSTYETVYNSGIGSNGLTFARHELLSYEYAEKYPESFDPAIPSEYVYTGKRKLTDQSDIEGFSIGKLLLSPTRTYLPVLRDLIKDLKPQIHGLIHCTGGGQTKVMHFIKNIKVVKDNLFEIPPIFKHIKEQTDADWKEMYKVFNMGHRMEVYIRPEFENQVIEIASKYNIRAKRIGFCEQSDKTTVIIKTESGVIEY
jgi:phosphoribosylformylglycinamidine cyclo-ligase